MPKKQQEFAKGLKYESAQEVQDKIAKEAIRRELFKNIFNFDVENGNKLELNHVVDLIGLELGIESDKEKLKTYVEETIQSGKYKYKIKEGYIISDFDKVSQAQKERSDKEYKLAKETLQSFIQRVETFASDLSHKRISITEESLKSQFDEEEIEDNKIWINLAVTKFLSSQNQER